MTQKDKNPNQPSPQREQQQREQRQREQQQRQRQKPGSPGQKPAQQPDPLNDDTQEHSYRGGDEDGGRQA